MTTVITQLDKYPMLGENVKALCIAGARCLTEVPARN